LDKERQDILPFFKEFKKDFYLAGGTALALQIGHRDSIDFDFFSPVPFDTAKLFENILKIFSGHEIKKTQEAANTLSVLVDSRIKISFFAYPYNLISEVLEDGDLSLASVADIGCMKLSAVVSRGVLKDYVDLYFILRDISLGQLLDYAKQKFPQIETNLILKSLVFFEDLEEEPVNFKHDRQVDFSKVKEFLSQAVKEYANK
jgi:hypothetical protein